MSEEREELQQLLVEDISFAPARPEDEQDILNDALVREVMAEPYFTEQAPAVKKNSAQKERPARKQPTEAKEDRLTVGLMFTASALCLGIIAVMIYWLVAYQL